MNWLLASWAWFGRIGLKSAKQIALEDLEAAERDLLEWEKNRENAVAMVTMLRSRIHRLRGED